MVDFEWNKSVKWSKLGIDGRTYPLLLVSIFIGWFLWVWVLLVLLFMYAGIKGVPLSMIFRKLKVKVSGKRMEAYPIHKQHGLKYGIALAVAMLTIHLPQESFAKFEAIDSLHYGVEWQQGDVAPHAGAWIETALIQGGFPVKYVAPHAGAWIETVLHFEGAFAPRVAPHAGAWIETDKTYEFAIFDLGRAPCGRVD